MHEFERHLSARRQSLERLLHRLRSEQCVQQVLLDLIESEMQIRRYISALEAGTAALSGVVAELILRQRLQEERLAGLERTFRPSI